MNIRKIFRSLANFLVPTPATVRRHRAPSARFTTLEALAKTHGDTLTRDGRSYTLATSDLRVLEFDNLAQVKAHMCPALGCIAPKSEVVVSGDLARADGGPYPGDADYVERPRNMYKITGGPSPEVPQGDNYDIGQTPDVKIRHVYKIDADGNLKPGPAEDVGSSAPFVPVVAVPITTVAPTSDINRD